MIRLEQLENVLEGLLHYARLVERALHREGLPRGGRPVGEHRQVEALEEPADQRPDRLRENL